MTFRILHTADWHVCNEFLHDASQCLGFMMDYLQDMERGGGSIDLIVISGDIYNHRQIQQETSAARLVFNIVRRLGSFAPVVILSGTPSHDGDAPLILNNIGDALPVLVVADPSSWVLYQGDGFLTDFQPIGVESPAPPKAMISFTPAFTKQYFASGSDTETSDREIGYAMGMIYGKMGTDYNDFNRHRRQKSKAALIPHVLLGHYSVGGAFIHPSQPMIGKDIEISLDHLDLANTSINCLGHIHAAQKVGQNSYYCGSLFATDFGEFEKKGFYIHELELVDMGHHWEVSKSDFIETPSPTLVKIEIDLIKNARAPDDLLRYILQQSEEVPWEHTENYVIRMEIKTYQDEADLIDRDDIEEYFKTVRSFKLDIIRIPRDNVRSSMILEADRLRDKIKARAEIIDGEIPDQVLDLADQLQDVPGDVLLDAMSKLLLGKEGEYETT
jgi:DNA repair exonuclease SbcCD nuclease subunit